MKISDLTKDFSDGILLFNLLEIISGKKVGKITLGPKTRHHKVNNLYSTFLFLKNEKLQLGNIQAEGKLNFGVGVFLITPKFRHMRL